MRIVREAICPAKSARLIQSASSAARTEPRSEKMHGPSTSRVFSDQSMRLRTSHSGDEDRPAEDWRSPSQTAKVGVLPAVDLACPYSENHGSGHCGRR